jgi:RNA polymerase sigma-70 factor (ECF subfamily)
VERVFRDEYGRVLAALVRTFRDIDVAEDVVADALLVALERWPITGVPPSPAAWIITTARNRAIDRLRRESTRDDRHAEFVSHSLQSPRLPADSLQEASDDVVPDDRLRLIFTCCHPALSPEAQLALTLRLLGGLTTTEIARAFLVPESTMAQRIVRAKHKIRDARIPYALPRASDLRARMTGVLRTLYLIFNEGYVASVGDALVRAELCVEAIRLTRIVVHLLPDDVEAKGLLALLLLIHARRPAREAASARLVPLTEQDRALWNRECIAEGQALLRVCLARNAPGPYQLQAAIQAVHADAPHTGATDWQQILVIYDQLMQVDGSPVAAVHRAVALAEVRGAQAALDDLDRLKLDGYYLFHAVRADFLRRLGRIGEAAVALDRAGGLTQNGAEREFLGRQRDELVS